MTDAWAKVIAAVITGGCTLAAAIIAGRIPSRERPRKAVVVPIVVAGLVVGVLVGWLVGSVLLRRPTPCARISAPEDGDLIGHEAQAIVEYESIPRDRHLWLAVRVPGEGRAWYIYPQLPDEETEIRGEGTLVMTVSVHDDEDGDPYDAFNVVVLLVTEEANSFFEEYANNCGSDAERCVGMMVPSEGVEILDFTTVFRAVQ